MAKKGSKIVSRAKRKQPLSIDEIAKVHESVVAVAGDVESCLAEMRHRRLKVIEIDGVAKTKLGVAKIREFVANFRRAMQLIPLD